MNILKRSFFAVLLAGLLATSLRAAQIYTVVDTGQTNCYDNTGAVIAPAPATNSVYYGQDAQFQGIAFSFHTNGDGTVSDLNTGLMWQQTTATNTFAWSDATNYATTNRLAGYSDWRLPSIKELYSLAAYYGTNSRNVYIDTSHFTLWNPTNFGQTSDMGQTWAVTPCASLPHTGNQDYWMFNFSDGHLKGNTAGPNWVRLVRGNSYGANQFVKNGDGTVTDWATGLMWQQSDEGAGRNWTNALVYAATNRLAGYSDWRLPNAKELQSIVDYTNAPDAANPSVRCAAIDTNYFTCSLNVVFTNHYQAYFWTGTTACDQPILAYYVSFGEAMSVLGFDTHCAGAVRSDPKSGSSASWPNGLGPSPSDLVVVTNFVRLVRTAILASFSATPTNGGAPLTVTFTDNSTGSVTNRFWSFGDGATTNTTGTNVAHTYGFPGTNTVSLIVSGASGCNTNIQTNLVVATSVDSVGDGIPDWWRAEYFGGTGTTTNTISCATCDPDGDGFNNWQEYLADTNPTNALSYFHIQSITFTTAPTAFYQSSASRTYSLYYKTNLASAMWKAIPMQTNISGSGGVDSLSDTNALDVQRFYRIGVALP